MGQGAGVRGPGRQQGQGGRCVEAASSSTAQPPRRRGRQRIAVGHGAPSPCQYSSRWRATAFRSTWECQPMGAAPMTLKAVPAGATRSMRRPDRAREVAILGLGPLLAAGGGHHHQVAA